MYPSWHRFEFRHVGVTNRVCKTSELTRFVTRRMTDRVGVRKRVWKTQLTRFVRWYGRTKAASGPGVCGMCACTCSKTANYMSIRWQRVTTHVERAASVVLSTARAHLAVCALGSEGKEVARFPARQSVANSLL